MFFDFFWNQNFQNHFSPRKNIFFDPIFFYDLEFIYTFDFTHPEHLRERMESGRLGNSKFLLRFPGSGATFSEPRFTKWVDTCRLGVPQQGQCDRSGQDTTRHLWSVCFFVFSEFARLLVFIFAKDAS